MWKRRDALSALSFFLLLALFGILAGFELLLAAVLAASFHEIGHLGVLRLFSAEEGRLLFHPSGLEWRREEKRLLSYPQEILSLLAGPAMNFLWAAVLGRFAVEEHWETGFVLSGAQLMLGLFNLLPVLPLDGGKALELLLSWLIEPFFAYRVLRALSLAVGGALLLFSLALFFVSGRVFLLFTASMLFFLVLRELGLVKECRSG